MSEKRSEDTSPGLHSGIGASEQTSQTNLSSRYCAYRKTYLDFGIWLISLFFFKLELQGHLKKELENSPDYLA